MGFRKTRQQAGAVKRLRNEGGFGGDDGGGTEKKEERAMMYAGDGTDRIC